MADASPGPEGPLKKDDPEAVALTHAASAKPELHRYVEVLTSLDSVRGCAVNPDRGVLQALQNAVGWTIGGFDTRPVPEAMEQKKVDRLQILLSYRQDETTSAAPRVRMYDYLCDILFGIPMTPVGPDVVMPDFQDLEGHIVKAQWIEANFNDFRDLRKPRPAPVFAANRYPYQLPIRSADTEVQAVAQHWLLWYLHFPWEEVADFSDDQIDKDVRREVELVARSYGFDRVDYVWYRNPAASVPDMFHVQVFWIVPESAMPVA